MIEIRDDRFYFGFWWAGCGRQYDWLAVVWRDGDRVQGMFRHRFGDDNDRRSWYTFGGQLKPNTEVCAQMDDITDLIVHVAVVSGFVDANSAWDVQKRHVCAMGDVFGREFAAASFAHLKEVPESERAEIERELAGRRSC